MKNQITPIQISDYLKQSVKRLLIGIPLLILFCFILLSCGARKVEKSETEKEVKTQTIDVVKKDVVTDTNIKTETKTIVIDSTKEEIEETEVTPIDNLKPAIYEGKEITNTKIVKRKIKRNKALNSETSVNTNEDKKTTDKTVNTTKKQESTKENTQIKNSDRKQFDILAFLLSYWWLWIIIIVLLYMLKKYVKFPLS